MRSSDGSADPENGKDKKGFTTFSRIYREAAPYLTLGIQLAATVVVMFYLGYWGDEYFGTKPWLMITGLALGVAAGFYSFFKTIIDLGKEEM
jgi:F0F1-type ATP synthase assembly protein I